MPARDMRYQVFCVKLEKLDGLVMAETPDLRRLPWPQRLTSHKGYDSSLIRTAPATEESPRSRVVVAPHARACDARALPEPFEVRDSTEAEWVAGELTIRDSQWLVSHVMNTGRSQLAAALQEALKVARGDVFNMVAAPPQLKRRWSMTQALQATVAERARALAEHAGLIPPERLEAGRRARQLEAFVALANMPPSVPVEEPDEERTGRRRSEAQEPTRWYSKRPQLIDSLISEEDLAQETEEPLRMLEQEPMLSIPLGENLMERLLHACSMRYVLPKDVLAAWDWYPRKGAHIQFRGVERGLVVEAIVDSVEAAGRDERRRCDGIEQCGILLDISGGPLVRMGVRVVSTQQREKRERLTCFEKTAHLYDCIARTLQRGAQRMVVRKRLQVSAGVMLQAAARGMLDREHARLRKHFHRQAKERASREKVARGLQRQARRLGAQRLLRHARKACVSIQRHARGWCERQARERARRAAERRRAAVRLQRAWRQRRRAAAAQTIQFQVRKWLT